MATSLLDLVRSAIPNFSLRELRALVPWFEAVTLTTEQPLAHVNLDGTFKFQRGFVSSTVVGPGVIDLTLTNAIDPAKAGVLLSANWNFWVGSISYDFFSPTVLRVMSSLLVAGVSTPTAVPFVAHVIYLNPIDA